jgi:hypothetical protein
MEGSGSVWYRTSKIQEAQKLADPEHYKILALIHPLPIWSQINKIIKQKYTVHAKTKLYSKELDLFSLP